MSAWRLLLALLALSLLSLSLAQETGEPAPTPTPTPAPGPGQSDLPEGSACGNADTCAADLLCINNQCQTATLFPDALDGWGNACSESDCCREELQCVSATNSCQPLGSLTPDALLVQCQAGQEPTPEPQPEPEPEPTLPGLPAGSGCSNWDTCEGGVCLRNRCVPTNETNMEINGLGNVCSSVYCCPGELACAGSPVPVCVLEADVISSVACAVNTTNTTRPEPLAGEYNECNSQEGCASAPGLVCLANRCVRREWWANATEGEGNACDAELCCPNELVCSLSLGVCRVRSEEDSAEGAADVLLCGPPGPVVPVPPVDNSTDSSTGAEQPDQGGAEQSTADGQVPTPTPQPQPTVPEGGVPEGGACDNNRLCAEDLRCLSNRCQSGVNLPYGYGNACNADKCCYRGQVCVTVGNVCAPELSQVVGTPTVACNGAQPEPVDAEGNDLNDRGAASAAGTSAALLALLAAAGVVMAAI